MRKENETKRLPFFFDYCRERRKGVLRSLLFCSIFGFVFLLYHLPFDAVLYPSLLCGGLGGLFLLSDYHKAYMRHCHLVKMRNLSAAVMDCFPEAGGVLGQDYQEIIQRLRKEQQSLTNQLNAQYDDLIAYYTMWVHQIKTPIAAMRLYLQNEDTEFSHKIARELQRIEQYVEMVLVYLRLDTAETDYVIKELDMDKIISEAVKKFSIQFIEGKISLVYEPLLVTVVSDEKWLSFVIEQVLSNALKYTPEGGTIRISLVSPKVLCIADTGMGIAPEDLPRVFTKGYTGHNGRTDKRASGIGLSLCKEICDKLGHDITISSALGEGTSVRIDLQQEGVIVE
ncbi:MAG: HAMP domain-containing histidine kinase [Peptococcaceae bacterium]|jgi:two-component system sensor histidine kinase BraS/BceS|nr:HAMP domain-containing histidine kinase [Peptococcaceae bacterium]